MMDFNSATPSNSFIPPTKKPKLSIDKLVCISQPNHHREKYAFDEMWGDDDLDIAALEKLQCEETLALSQMPKNEVMQPKPRSYTTTGTPNYKATPAVTHAPKLSQSKPVNQLSTNSGSQNSDTQLHPKSSPKVPLRRTASSGWPSANTFNSQSSRLPSDHHTNFTGPCRASSSQNERETLQLRIKQLEEKLNEKTGEAKVLSDRLRNVQIENNKKVSKLEKDYAEKTNNLKQDAESTIAKLSKEKESLQSQLNVKAMETEMRLNRAHLDSPNNRSRIAIRSVSSPKTISKQLPRPDQLTCGKSNLRVKINSLPFELLRDIVAPELLKPTQPEVSIVESVRTITNTGLFSDVLKKQLDENAATTSAISSKSVYYTAGSSSDAVNKLTMKDKLSNASRQLSDTCPPLGPCCIPFLSTRLMDITSDNTQEVLSEVIDTCLQILTSLLSQLNSAVCTEKKRLEREAQVTHNGYKNLMLTEDYNLLISKELYNNERGICARRALALLSLLVDISGFAAGKILPWIANSQPEQGRSLKNCDTSVQNSNVLFDSHMTLSIVNEIITQIEKQRRTLMFEGVLASATSLIKNLLQTNLVDSKQSQDVIVSILRGVVCSRPGSLVIHLALEALLAATKYPHITDSLCHNSAKETFVENMRDRVSFYTFTPDTCILQVLCVGLLIGTPTSHVLSDTFTSWVLTLFNDVERSPRWLFSTPSQTTCQCRPLVSRLAFKLLGEAALHYPSVSDQDSQKGLLKSLMRRGVLLVYFLLYHDEHFGVNVDSIGSGYYELFLHSLELMNQFDVSLEKACREILKTLCEQEALRQPSSYCSLDNQSSEVHVFLSSLYQNQKNEPYDVYNKLDSIC